MINTQILNYKIISLIGKGGMANVYEGEHVNLGTKVAIKILDPVLASKGNIKERFRNEARIMASLKHENIVQVLDYYENEEDSIYAIVMEMLEGDTLSDFVSKQGKLTKELVYDIMTKTLNAFAHAHSKGLIHRDVKPSNLFVTKDKNIKILDFGIAKIIGQDAELTSTGMQMGTPMYMSPEQVKDSKHIDQRSDIYSLGVMMYFMLTGKRPYDTNTNSNFDILNKIVNEPLPTLSEYPGLSEIIQKATAKDPNDRFVNASEFANALKRKKRDKEQSANEASTMNSNVNNSKHAIKLKSNVDRANIAVFFIILVTIFALVSIYSSVLQLNLINLFDNSGNVYSDNELIAMAEKNDLREQTIGIIYLILFFISSIFFIRWFYRAYSNISKRTFTKFSPGWAIWGWFIPILNFFRPYQVMNDMWKKVYKIGGVEADNYYYQIVSLWWALRVIGGILGILTSMAYPETNMELRNSTYLDIIISIIDIISGIITIMLIKKYSSMEWKLINI